MNAHRGGGASLIITAEYIDTLDVMIESVSEPPSALLPIFRSEQQLRLLGVLFDPGVVPLSVGELARRAGVAQATASRELARLEAHGIVTDELVGRTRLVRANRALPWAGDLQAILAKTVGIPAVLGRALSPLDGVAEAVVFGSWAARYHGQPGPPPADLDVAVIGVASKRDVRTVCLPLESVVGLEINVVIVTEDDWTNGAGFASNIRSAPTVAIPLER